MKNIAINIKNISVVIILASLARVSIWFSQTSPTSPTTSIQPKKSLGSATNMQNDVSMPQLKSTQFHALIDVNNNSQKLIGTWVKYQINIEGNRYSADDKWHLSVTFGPDRHFLWDCKQYGDNGETIDASLTGTYSFERGFLITYKFDKPSPAAQKSLPELFAFWPNQLKGQHTFRFHDDTLILGHDGNKLWLYLIRKIDVE
jgi:hypothetical protein